MDSKDIKNLFLNRMASGETTNDILAEIAAVANEIEAEAIKNKGNDEVKKVISEGTQDLIAGIAFEDTPLSGRDLLLIIVTWMAENSNLMNSIPKDFDFVEFLDIEEKHLNEMVKSIGLLTEMLDTLNTSSHKAKVKDKAKCDPITLFFEKNGLI